MRDFGLSSRAIVFASTLLLAAGSASAQDWSGAYVGVYAGGGWSDNTITDTTGFSNNPAGTDISNDKAGFVGGALAGFNVQSDNLVFGAELDGGLAALKASTAVDPIELDETGSSDYGFMGSARARLGFAADSVLIYATGGLAFASIENSLTDTDLGVYDPSDSFSDKSLHVGWVAGGGVEAKFADDWSGRVEGLYYDFGSDTNRTTGSNAPFSVENSLFVGRVALIKSF